MQRYFIYFAYDGTAYHGWQIQPNGISVQEVLQDALSKILRRKTEVVGAGRTDTGVHARLMVAHFNHPEAIDGPQLTYRLNRLLPSDISINKVVAVEETMHARFSAKWRTYRYYVHTCKAPFLRHYSYETPYALDYELMAKGAERITHHEDFAAFCKSGADNKTTLCTVRACKWVQTSDHSWYFEITANRFLRNMVRATVGTLFLLGRHKISLTDPRRRQPQSRRREHAAPRAVPRGH